MSTPTPNAAELADKLMKQAQVFASAWSIASSRFDMGDDGYEIADVEKACLRSMLEDAISAVSTQAARIAALDAALAQQVPGLQLAALPAYPEDAEDLVTIPRGLIGAACSAIDHKRDAPKLLEKLRRYTVGDLSRQPAQQVPEPQAKPVNAQMLEVPTRDDLIAALEFYAKREHMMLADESAWDTVSGEPQNWWCDEAGSATIEDGTIAKQTLAGNLTAEQINAMEDGDEFPDDSDTAAEAAQARSAQQVPAVPDEWRDTMARMVMGIDHLAEIARLWEPDYSTRADRRGWGLAKDARDDAMRLLAAAPLPAPTANTEAA